MSNFTDVVELAFLRLATKAEIFARPLTIAEARGALATWHAAPAAVRATGDLPRAATFCQRRAPRATS